MELEQIEEDKLVLCDELLLIIFEYVGKHRENLKLTCKKFYKIICDIEKNKFPLKINNEIASI